MQHSPEVTSSQNGKAPRLVWPDALKGLAIILVVIGHVWRGIEKPGLLPPDLFTAVDQRIYAFHMPLFFLVSGLFFLRVLTRGSSAAFLKGRLARLIWPLLLWSYIFMAAKLLAGSAANQPISADELTLLPIPGQWHMWFLWALFVIHMAMLPLRPVLTTQIGRVAVLLISLPLSLSIWPPEVFYWIGHALQVLPYFMMGMVLAPFTARLRTPVWLGVAMLCLFAVLLAAYPWLSTNEVVRLAIRATLVASLIVGLMTLPRAALRALAWVGVFSMAIFLAHVIFSAGIRAVLLKLQVEDPAVHVALGTLIGVALPITLHKLAQRLRVTRVLGFAG